MKKYEPVSLKKIRTYPLTKRKSKVELASTAKPHKKGRSFKNFIDEMPDILAAKDLRSIVTAIIKAKKNKKPVILGMGAHPIKVGLSSVIIDLMEKHIITAVATNGACIVHDFELSYTGKTSEDVAAELATGRFGMAKETGEFINKAIMDGVKKGYGIGRSIGEMIYKNKFRFSDKSIFATAYRLGIPASVHVAVGTDIVHMHPNADGSAIGEGSLRDFRLLASVVSDLEGGVYINLGSAVILPEVFLKALTIARNLGNRVENITTVNMDFIQHYRPGQNVLKRPTINKGSCYALTGHHEIMFPLLAATVIENI
ncbi:MAG: deoxyhypusine synthase family protein [Nitrospiraceae bacterium]|nr:deoxyhypusine synthase family protein [Nitrospiraceae bacterium]